MGLSSLKARSPAEIHQPVGKVSRVHEVTPMREIKGYLEPQQIVMLIQAATNPRDRAFIALLARTGVRISEAVGLKVGDIDVQGGDTNYRTSEGESKTQVPTL